MSEENRVSTATQDEESLKTLFEAAMKLFDSIEKSQEATNSESSQMTVKSAITKLERATNLVSLSGMFCSNESLEELPTDTLQYLLLPALLGTLTLKLCQRTRKDVITVAEVYFRDFLQRCKDYGVTDAEIPMPSECETTTSRALSEQARLMNMVQTRESKIKRYKEAKELKEKLSTLSKAMESAADEEIKREYFCVLLRSYVNQALEELASIEMEKPLLEYMEKNSGASAPKPKPRPPPLKPVIITRDAVQKAVFGAGYPALPSLTIEEFYDQRVREGLFPGSSSNVACTTVRNAEANPDEAEEIKKESLVEQDDPEELQRQRNMDEFKDEHRRGEGNRHNRS